MHLKQVYSVRQCDKNELLLSERNYLTYNRGNPFYSNPDLHKLIRTYRNRCRRL